MIYVLHGEDTLTSYNHILKIVSRFQTAARIHLTQKNTLEDFITQFSPDLFNELKVIICENYLGKNLVKIKDLETIPKDQIVILWEETQLSPVKISQLSQFAQIENFKLKSYLFWFLDSLSPKSTKYLNYLSKIDKSKTGTLLWQMATRVFLLICAKRNFTRQATQEITNKGIANWQWDIVKRQSEAFRLKTLINFYRGIVKLDFTVKSGKTLLAHEELIPLLLLKYLKD